LVSAQLPEASYFTTTFLGELFNSSILLLVFGLGYIFFLYKTDRLSNLFVSWSELPNGKNIRIFVFIISFVLTWIFASYDFNYYYNQWHYSERILLVLLTIAIWWRSFFTLPYILLLVAVVSQFNHPLGIGFTRPIDNLLIQITTLFSAWFIFFTIKQTQKIETFVFLVCCLIAGHYWFPGWGKLGLNWIMYGNIHFITLNAYAHGWLAFLAPEEIVQFAKQFEKFDTIFVIGTMVIEVGALFFLWRLRNLKLFILAWIGFHSIVFVMTGYLFWKWVLLELALWYFFFRKNLVYKVEIFSKPYFALSLGLILFIAFWNRPAKLCWYDTNLAYTYRFEAIVNEKPNFTIAPGFFAPYDDIFVFGTFSFLSKQHQLVGPYGATKNPKIVEEILGVKLAEDIFSIEDRYPPQKEKNLKTSKFDYFIKQFVKNYNSDQTKKTKLALLQPPPTFWSFARGKTFSSQAKVEKIIVSQVTSFYDGVDHKDIRNRVVREIEI